MMPLHEATLESDRVKLTPFIPSLYARPYADQVKAHPDFHRWYSFDLSNLDNILSNVETVARRNPTAILFAVIDKARGNAFAGVIALLTTFPMNLSTELGWLVIFPEFSCVIRPSNHAYILTYGPLPFSHTHPFRRSSTSMLFAY
jgi:hypothetical protein